MNYVTALKRAAATFVVGASAVPLGAAELHVSTLKLAAFAGAVAVWQLIVHTAQAALANSNVTLTIPAIQVIPPKATPPAPSTVLEPVFAPAPAAPVAQP